MEEQEFRSWKEFKEQEYRRVNTFQLCIDDLARDLYYDPLEAHEECEEKELNFDY